MPEISVEIDKDSANNRLNKLVFKQKGKQVLDVMYVYDAEGFVRGIKLKGKDTPSISELLRVVNQRWLDQIENIRNIANIENIENIEEIEDIATIGSIEKLDSASVSQNPIRNNRFRLGFEAWYVDPDAMNVSITIEDDALYEKRVKFSNSASKLRQFCVAATNQYPYLSLRAWKAAGAAGADLVYYIYYSDGTNSHAVLAITEDRLSYTIALTPSKIVDDIQFYDNGGICYLALPQFVELFFLRGCVWGYRISNTGVSIYRNLYLMISSVDENVCLTPIWKGTLLSTKLRVYINTSLTDYTLTLRKNGVNTAHVVTVTAGLIGDYSSDVSVDFVDGDELSWYETGVSGGNILYEASCKARLG
jgi:hypothetical protein